MIRIASVLGPNLSSPSAPDLRAPATMHSRLRPCARRFVFFAAALFIFAPGVPVVMSDSFPVPRPARPVSIIAPLTRLHVVLLAGQSNADGRAPGASLPAPLCTSRPAVWFYSYVHEAAANADGTLGLLGPLLPGRTQFPAGGFGPEITLGHALADTLAARPGHALAIIKYAKGGSSLAHDWRPGGDATSQGDGPHYQVFQRVVRDGFAALRATHPEADIELTALVWVQGESDVSNSDAFAQAYEENLLRFFADLRLSLDHPDLPIVFSRLSDQQTIYSDPASEHHARCLMVRAAKTHVAQRVHGTRLIATDGAAFGFLPEHLRYDATGQQALGKILATAVAPFLDQP